MDSPSQASQPTTGRAELAVAELRRERADTLKAFLGLTETETQLRIDWRGASQSVNQRILAFTTHLIDHQQHLLRLLFARGRGVTSAEYLLMKAAAEMAVFEVMCLALDDDDFTAQGPTEEDWSTEQILEHVIRTERVYRERILAGIAAATAGDGSGTPA